MTPSPWVGLVTRQSSLNGYKYKNPDQTSSSPQLSPSSGQCSYSYEPATVFIFLYIHKTVKVTMADGLDMENRDPSQMNIHVKVGHCNVIIILLSIDSSKELAAFTFINYHTISLKSNISNTIYL